MNTPKTLEEHRSYLYQIIRLKLFFAANWKKAHPEEELGAILRDRVDIIRKLDINPEGLNPYGNYFVTPAWKELESRLCKVFELVKGDTALFEEWGFDVLKPQLDLRCKRDYEDLSPRGGYQCGFLRYNVWIDPATPDRLVFHIANDCAPDSFFDHPEHIKECFTQLLDAAENQFHVHEIGTGTWLNSCEKWVKLFPEEWKKNMLPPNKDVHWHYGFWGQFINARGLFNEKLGAQLRATMELPFYPRASWCTIEAMRKKLSESSFC